MLLHMDLQDDRCTEHLKMGSLDHIMLPQTMEQHTKHDGDTNTSVLNSEGCHVNSLGNVGMVIHSTNDHYFVG